MASKETLRKRAYDQEQTRRYQLKLNRKTDAQIIDHLDHVPSKQGYIRALIRSDIESQHTKAYGYSCGFGHKGIVIASTIPEATQKLKQHYGNESFGIILNECTDDIIEIYLP